VNSGAPKNLSSPIAVFLNKCIIRTSPNQNQIILTLQTCKKIALQNISQTFASSTPINQPNKICALKNTPTFRETKIHLHFRTLGRFRQAKGLQIFGFLLLGFIFVG